MILTEDFVLLSYQQKWLADESDVKIWEKSRRIGATWCEAADAVLKASSADSPQDVLYISVGADLAFEFIRDAADWAKAFNVVASEIEVAFFDETKDIKSFQITFNSGKRIIALSSKPRNLRGREGIVILDEFSHHDNPEELVKAAMAFLMWGGKVRILSTHNGIDSYFNQLIEEVRKGKKPYSIHRTTIEDALEAGLFKRICLKIGKKWTSSLQEEWIDSLIKSYPGHEEELYCVPNSSGGKYLSRLLVERNMEPIPVISLDLPDSFIALKPEDQEKEIADWCEEKLNIRLHPHYRSSYGFDFGRSGDLSVLAVFAEQPDLVRRTVYCVEMRNVPFKCQEQVLFYIGDRLPRLVGGAHDARGNGQYLAEVAAARYGDYRIAQVMLTTRWYLENMPKYKAALEDNQVVLPQTADILTDHLAVEVINGIPKVPDVRSRGSNGKSRHGDAAIAYCLAWYASCMDTEWARPSLGTMGFSSL